MKKIFLSLLIFTYTLFAQTLSPNTNASSLPNNHSQNTVESVKTTTDTQRLERAVIELRNQVDRLIRVMHEAGPRQLYSCYVRNTFTGKTYPATEYTPTAARGMALKLCADETKISSACKDLDVVCDPEKRE